MAIQTKPTDRDPRDFIANVTNQTRKRDAFTLLEIYEEVTRESPRMWGPSIIGFGQYHYQYASGHEGDWPKGGFSPRAAHMVCYLMRGVESYENQLKDLGPKKYGKSCLYLGSFDKLNLAVLKNAITEDWQWMSAKYG